MTSDSKATTAINPSCRSMGSRWRAPNMAAKAPKSAATTSLLSTLTPKNMISEPLNALNDVDMAMSCNAT